MSNKTSKNCTIRKMQLADMDFLHRMVTIAGWNQVDADWRRYLYFEPEGCYVAEFNHHPVGTVTTTSYENKIGWIGMVIVDPQARGLGVGSTLMRHVIDYLQHRVRVIKLDATLQGFPIYKKLGFEEEYEIVKLEGKGGNFLPTNLSHISFELLPMIIKFDKIAFGASRETVLKQLLQEYQKFTFYEMHHGEISGYIMATRGRKFWQIGPWVAKSPGIAENLLNALLMVGGENRFVIDVPRVTDVPFSLCMAKGFTEQRKYVRMFLGENRWQGDPSMVYATGRAEKG